MEFFHQVCAKRSDSAKIITSLKKCAQCTVFSDMLVNVRQTMVLVSSKGAGPICWKEAIYTS